MLRSDLCDCRNGYMVKKRKITAEGNSSSNSEKLDLKNLH